MVPTPIVRTLYSILNDGNDMPEHIDCIMQSCIMTIHGEIMFNNDPIKEPPPPQPPPNINMINKNEEVTSAPAYPQIYTNKVQEVPTKSTSPSTSNFKNKAKSYNELLADRWDDLVGKRKHKVSMDINTKISVSLFSQKSEEIRQDI